MSNMSKSLGGGKSKSKKKKKSASKKHKIKRMTIDPTDNGGFLATHQHQPDDEAAEGEMGGGGPPDTMHALSDTDQLQQHIADHFGGTAPQAAPVAGPAGPGAGPTGM